MKKLKELKLNPFQLNILFNENEKEGFKMLLNQGVYCMHCNDFCKNGVVNYTTRLNSTNDIVVDGKCASCDNKVCRVMEFGEDRSFFEKAMKLKNSM